TQQLANTANRRGAVVHVLERLHEDDAVCDFGRQVILGGEVCSDRGTAVRRVDVEDVLRPHVDAERVDVAAVADLDDVARNVGPMLRQEPLDKMAIDRRAAIPSPAVAYRRRPTKTSQPNRTPQPTNASSRQRRAVATRRALPTALR